MRSWAVLGILALGVVAAGCDDETVGVSELAVVDLVEGTGAAALEGSAVKIDYTGWLYAATQPDNKGQEFDSSRGREPLAFVVGSGTMIVGLERGVLGMRVGGQRRILIPPDLAYGDHGAGAVIPPGASLVFEVTLIEVSS